MSARTPLAGSGCLRWNAVSWFGLQFGLTFWLLPLAVGMWSQGGRGLALAVVACLFVPNLLGLVLWTRRDRVRPYPAVRLLVLAAGISAGVALALVTWASTFGIARAAANPWWLLLLFPALLLVFRFVERGGRKADK
jgi:hypothetical protein